MKARTGKLVIDQNDDTPHRPRTYLEDGAVQIIDHMSLVVVGGGSRTPSRAVGRARQPLLGLRDECCCLAVVLGDVGAAGVEHGDEVQDWKGGREERREGGRE